MQDLNSCSDLNRLRPHPGQPMSLRVLDTIDRPGRHHKASGTAKPTGTHRSHAYPQRHTIFALVQSCRTGSSSVWCGDRRDGAMVHGLGAHGSHRRVDGFQDSADRVSTAALKMVVGCGIAGHGGFSVVVLIQIRSPLGPRPSTRLRRRNYTRVKTTGDNSGDFRDEAGDAQGISWPCCG